MGFVTPLFALLIFSAIVIIALVIAFMIVNPSDYPSSRAYIFINALYGLGIFITFLFFYSVIELQQQQQRLTEIQETNRIYSQITEGIMEEIRKASYIVPAFCLSLLPLLDPREKLRENPKENPKDENEKAKNEGVPLPEVEQIILSTKIFAAWRSFINFGDFVVADPQATVCLFLQFATSKPLFLSWPNFCIDYDKKTVQFADLLFEYSQREFENSPEGFAHLSKSLIADPRYKKLVEKKKPFSLSL